MDQNHLNVLFNRRETANKLNQISESKTYRERDRERERERERTKKEAETAIQGLEERRMIYKGSGFWKAVTAQPSSAIICYVKYFSYVDT